MSIVGKPTSNGIQIYEKFAFFPPLIHNRFEYNFKIGKIGTKGGDEEIKSE